MSHLPRRRYARPRPSSGGGSAASTWRWCRAGVLLLLIVAAAAAPWIAPYGPTTPDYDNVLAGPSWQHLCGTDTFGRDIFSRILWGGRISLTVGFVSVALGGLVGVVLGSGQRVLRRAGRRHHHAADGCAAGVSRHPAGDRRRGVAGARDRQRHLCHRGVQRTGVRPPGARQHAGAEADACMSRRRAASACARRC